MSKSKSQKARLEEAVGQWKRAVADYQNLQKEVIKEREVVAKRCLSDLTERMLPVVDNFKTAMKDVPKTEGAKAWVEGIGHIYKQMGDALEEVGVKKIPTVGKEFDPAKMEAVGEEESDEHQPGIVIRETQTGYLAGDVVIRPAKVIIASERPEDGEGEDS